LSLAIFLAACGGDESSTPIVNVNTGDDTPTQDEGGTNPGNDTSPENGNDTGANPDDGNTTRTFKIGSFDSTGSFQEGKIRVDNPLMVVPPSSTERASTRLRAAILNEDGELDTNGHTVEFVSTCTTDIPGDVATINTTGSTATGNVVAEYVTSKECLDALEDGKDTIIATFDGDISLRATAEISLSSYEFAIGSLDDLDVFQKGIVSLSEEKLDYNTDTNPTTNVSVAIGMYDTNGGYVGLLQGIESTIEIYSTCINSGLASIESTGSTSTGELISSYIAEGCVGSDTIYARVAGTRDTASATIDITAKEGQKLELGYFDDAGTFNGGLIGNTRDTALPLGVQTKLYLSIADAVTETPVKGQPLTVEFTSQCGEQPGATTSPLSVDNASVSLGYVEVLYTGQSCGSLTEDLVRAELTGVEGFTATAETTIALAELPAVSLSAELPDPTSLAPFWYSQSDRKTESTLRVQLTDNQDYGVDGETVSFSLDNPGTEDVAVLTPVNGGLTDAEGWARVQIQAKEGFDNVVFRVIASYTDADGNLLQTYSAPIAVNSKLPFEDRFSISTSNFAPDTQGKDGVQVQLTLLAADDQGNRIRGNTVVNFETDQGTIDPECVLDNEGRCTITWESLGIDSQNEGEKFATVRAYTQGRLSDGSTGEIDTQVPMLMSTSANIRVALDNNTIPAAGGAFCAEAWVEILGDGVRNSPPVGTTLTFEATAATLLPSTSNEFVLGSSSALLATPYSFTGCTYVEPDPEATEPMRLTVTATPPEGTAAFDQANE
jgi:hypothetical protein